MASTEAATRPALSLLGRLGLAARGVTYLVIAWLVLKIALGERSEEASQSGALALIRRQTAGEALLWVLGIGFAGYAVTRTAAGWWGWPASS